MHDNETFIDLFPDADPEATARPEPSADSLDPTRVLTKLPRWQDDALEVRATLGQGGMGVVRLAHQPALGRDVAVKTLRREHRTEDARWRVLQEAWAAGSLEHPNIVPVYSVGLDDEEMPYIVLKRLEGDRWTDRLREGGDLHDHLQVLEAVAQAVAYAHDRGVVHRDLKPDNVMIGAYDEVTLIDWGLAVTTADDPDRRLPRASDQRRPAGTPSYMAPEQLAEQGMRPSPQTDIYQLGGLLYTVLHGRPPHGKGKLEVVIDSVRRGLPPIDPTIDEEARALLERSMAQAPEQRHGDVQAFLADLRSYRQHHSARALLAEARRRGEALLSELSQSEPNPQLVQQEVGAVRFGYIQVRRAWPEAPAAVADQVFAAAARWHLERGEPGAAKLLLDDLRDPDPALEAAIEEALHRRQALQLEHQAMVEDQSPSTAIRTRAFVMALVGTLWIITPLVALRMGDDLSFFHGANACLLVLIGALAVWARESLGRSQVNRFLTGQLLAVPILQGLVLLLTDLQGGGRDEAVVAMMPAWAAMSMCNVALFGRVFLPLTLAFVGAAIVGTLRPAWSLHALTFANAVLLVNALVPWAPQLYQALVEGRRERLARNEESS